MVRAAVDDDFAGTRAVDVGGILSRLT